MSDALVIHRPEAIARGIGLYFTGEHCARGHVAPRRVVNSNCVECERVRQAKVAERESQKRPRGRPPGRPQEYGVMGYDIRELAHVSWPDNGRVEVVTDPNWLVNGEPRVVRKIAWRACMCCKRRFFSQDIAKVRICDYCKAHRDGGMTDF